jgi:hypothetical protein
MSTFRAEIARDLDSYKNSPRLITVDPQPVVCMRDRCYLVRDGQANFRDTAHISNVNAMQYSAVFDAAFKSALRAGTEVAKTVN